MSNSDTRPDEPFIIARKKFSNPDTSCAISNFTITKQIGVRFKIISKNDEMWIGLCTDPESVRRSVEKSF